MKNEVAVAEYPEDTEPGTPAPGRALRYIRVVGYALLAVEFACFAAWSTILYDRFSLTFDFAAYHQSWYLIAHGDLNPYNTMQGYFFWRGHSEFIMWPLALFYWLWPNGPMLLWLQDAAVVAAQAAAFAWGCDLARRYLPGRKAAPWLAGLGLVLLVINPWTWEAISFDFHTECIAAPFLVLLARDLWAGRRRVWAWLVPALACSDVSSAYTIAVGAGGLLALLARRRSWRLAGIRSRLLASRGTWLPALTIVVAGVVIQAVTRTLHSDEATPLFAYVYLENPPNTQYSPVLLLKGIATRPRFVLHVLWSKRHNTWESLASAGVLGAVFVWALPVAFLILVTNDLSYGYLFSEPGFQSIVLYMFVAAGTVGILAWLARHWQTAALVLAGVVLAAAATITVQHGPGTKNQWLTVPAATARTLNSILLRTPSSDMVVASQGVVGRFSGRKNVQPLFEAPQNISLDGSTTWVIIVPSSGIETLTPQQSTAAIAEMAHLPHAQLVVQANGVWAFRWTPPRGRKTLTLT